MVVPLTKRRASQSGRDNEQVSVESIEFEISVGHTGTRVYQEAGKPGLNFWEW